MIKLVHFASALRVRLALCGCAAVLLSACGGNGGDAGAADPATRTAAELLDSKAVAAASFDPRDPAVAEAASAAAIAGTSADETAGPVAGKATPEPETSVAAPQAGETHVAPITRRIPAPAGTARIYVAGAGPATVL